MVEIVADERLSGFIVFTDVNGLHAVRLGSVLAVSDADDTRDRTCQQLPGSRAVLVDATWDEVMARLN